MVLSSCLSELSVLLMRQVPLQADVGMSIGLASSQQFSSCVTVVAITAPSSMLWMEEWGGQKVGRALAVTS